MNDRTLILPDGSAIRASSSSELPPDSAYKTPEEREAAWQWFAKRGTEQPAPGWGDAERNLSSPSKSQEGGNEPSCRATSAELATSRPIPSREAGGLPDTLVDGENDPCGAPTEGAEPDRRERAQRAAAAGAALPCQNSNNSDKPAKRYRLQRIPGTDHLFRSKDNKDAVWEQLDGDTIQRWGKPSAAEAKAAFHLRLNVESFVQHWGRNHCLFFTVTDQDNLHPTKFARRWNHYLRRNGEWIVSFIRVLEPQKQGRPHYHLLVAVPWDTRADAFDWAAFDECQAKRKACGCTATFRRLRSRYRASAAPELVALWTAFRKVLPKYGLGRAELLPIRKGKEAISVYVGKYLEGGLILRRHSWKGCRRVEFDRRAKNAWLACTRVFAWHSRGASAWRKRVGELGTALGVADLDGIRRLLGSKWAYRLREAITLASDEDWLTLLHIFAAEVRCQPTREALLAVTLVRPDKILRACSPSPVFHVSVLKERHDRPTKKHNMNVCNLIYV